MSDDMVYEYGLTEDPYIDIPGFADTNENTMEDDGERMTFDSGCLREPTDGKGRYDLISPFALAQCDEWVYTDGDVALESIVNEAHRHIMKYQMGDRTENHLAAACRYISQQIALEYDEDVPAMEFSRSLSPSALSRLAKWYELGAAKYAPRNWEKGMPYSRCLDSAVRHLTRWRDGGRTEDHLAAVMWNLFAIMHYTALRMDEFDDLPRYSNEAVAGADEKDQRIEQLDRAVKSLSENLAGGINRTMLNVMHETYPSPHAGFKVLVVDFDGCLCVNKYPKVGEPNVELIEWLKRQQELGDKLILWTCREGKPLTTAKRWLAKQGLKFDAINENIPEQIALYGGDCRKVSGDIYIDDKSLRVIAR